MDLAAGTQAVLGTLLPAAAAAAAVNYVRRALRPVDCVLRPSR